METNRPLLIEFGPSSSARHALAVRKARRMAGYTAEESGGSTWHRVTVDLSDRLQCRRGIELMNLVLSPST